jgi:hypothetical protein
VTFRRRHRTSLAALAAVLAIGGAGGQPRRPTADSATTEPAVLDLYGPGYLIPPYRTVRWLVTNTEGQTITLAYDTAEDAGSILTSVDGADIRFTADRIVISSPDSGGWLAADDSHAVAVERFRQSMFVDTLDDLIPPAALPHVTVLEDRPETLSGVEYRYLHLELDHDAFRADRPARYWRWSPTSTFADGAGVELWVAEDGVVGRMTTERLTFQVTERSMLPLTLEMPPPEAVRPEHITQPPLVSVPAEGGS